MVLDSRYGKIVIEEAGNSFSKGKPDYTKYKSAINKGNFHSDLYKALSVHIMGEPPKTLLLIGSYNAGFDNFAVVDNDNLIILLHTEIYVIGIPNGEIINYVKLGDFFPLWSIYHFDNGFIIHGEIEIIKLSKSFEIEWSFSGSDIFTTPSDSVEDFVIQGDTVHLIDWNGLHYHLNKNGEEITEQ